MVEVEADAVWVTSAFLIPVVFSAITLVLAFACQGVLLRSEKVHQVYTVPEFQCPVDSSNYLESSLPPLIWIFSLTLH